MHCVDYIGLLERYDDINMLGFALADSLPPDQAAGQFPNGKTENIDGYTRFYDLKWHVKGTQLRDGERELNIHYRARHASE